MSELIPGEWLLSLEKLVNVDTLGALGSKLIETEWLLSLGKLVNVDTLGGLGV